jgi:hypothetical protein
MLNMLPGLCILQWTGPLQERWGSNVWVYTNVGRVLVFLETHWVRVSEAFLILDPVCFLYYYLYNRPGEGFKKLIFFLSPGFKVLVFKHVISISLQRWFLNKGYQKFCYFEHFISPKVHLAQKHLQILRTPQNLNPFSIRSTKLEGGLRSI